MLVIDKPAGLPMHTTGQVLAQHADRAARASATPTSRWRSRTGSIARPRASCWSRADATVASFLTRAFARRAVEKTYLALVKGHPPDEGRIDVPLKLLDTTDARDDGPGRERAKRAPLGHPIPRSCGACPSHALCEAHPETGRQHQIRVHFASLGHPIVGDKLYGAGEALFMRACDEGVTPELLACFDGLPRHALHAHRLTFPHPATGRPMTVESPLPPDLVEHIESSPRAGSHGSSHPPEPSRASPSEPEPSRAESGRALGKGGGLISCVRAGRPIAATASDATSAESSRVWPWGGGRTFFGLKGPPARCQPMAAIHVLGAAVAAGSIVTARLGPRKLHTRAPGIDAGGRVQMLPEVEQP